VVTNYTSCKRVVIKLKTDALSYISVYGFHSKAYWGKCDFSVCVIAYDLEMMFMSRSLSTQLIALYNLKQFKLVFKTNKSYSYCNMFFYISKFTIGQK